MQSDGIVGAQQRYILLSEKESLKRESSSSIEYQEEETSKHGGLMNVKSSCGAEMSIFKE